MIFVQEVWTKSLGIAKVKKISDKLILLVYKSSRRGYFKLKIAEGQTSRMETHVSRNKWQTKRKSSLIGHGKNVDRILNKFVNSNLPQ